MAIQVAPEHMSGEQIVALSRKHSLYEWSAQSAVDPIPVERAEGVYFYSPDGTRYLDFNSQLMSVNIGHGDARVTDAVYAQMQKLAYANPFMATEPRARLGAKLAEIMPGDIDVFFFTNGGAEANENAIKLARQFTGRQKIMARYRSYHGATGQVMVATGDPRRWAAETGVSGIVRFPDFHRWGRKDPEPVEQSLRDVEEVDHVRGAEHDRGHHRGDGRRHQRHPHPARRLHAGPPGAVRQVRHPAHRGRGHGRLRPDRQVVRGRSLGRGAGPHHDGQGPHRVIRAAGCRRHAPRDRRRLHGQGVLRRPDLQQPSRWLRGGPGHDRGVRGGRAHRACRTAWAT